MKKVADEQRQIAKEYEAIKVEERTLEEEICLKSFTLVEVRKRRATLESKMVELLKK